MSYSFLDWEEHIFWVPWTFFVYKVEMQNLSENFKHLSMLYFLTFTSENAYFETIYPFMELVNVSYGDKFKSFGLGVIMNEVER